MGGASELIRAVRTSAGLTQEELARRAETAQSLIARYESGSVSPTVRALSKLMAACGQELILSSSADPATKYSVQPTTASAGSDYLKRLG